MSTLISNTKKYVTDSLIRAEQLVEKAKDENDNFVKSYSITKKTKSDVDFYIVQIIIEYYTINELTVVNEG